MNADSLSFLILEFSSSLIMLALSHWNLCSCSDEYSIILDLSISPFVAFRLCSFNLVCKGLHVSPVLGFPHSHADSCVWFLALLFVSMLRSVVRDLEAVLMPYLLSALNFSDVTGACGIIAVQLISVTHLKVLSIKITILNLNTVMMKTSEKFLGLLKSTVETW